MRTKDESLTDVKTDNERWSGNYYQLAQIPGQQKSIALRYAYYELENYYHPRIDFIDHVLAQIPFERWRTYELQLDNSIQ